VTINLKTGIHGGFAAGDTFNSIEAVIGSGRPATGSSATPAATIWTAAPVAAISSTTRPRRPPSTST
jgi:hypothetical protein